MKLFPSIYRIISGTFLIAGTMIGAGMLGIPLVTGISGFFPGFLITSVVWLFMYLTGLLFLEVTLWMPDGSNVLSMSQRFFGPLGKWVAGGTFVFLYFCLMIAYFAAGAPLLGEALSSLGFSVQGWNSIFIFALIFGTIVAVGPRSIDRVNMLVSIAMVFSYLFLIGIGAKEVESVKLSRQEYSKMIFALPILFGAFGYQNVIPSLSTYLNRDRRSLRLSIFWGTFLSFIVYLVWQWIIIGSMSEGVLAKILKDGLPVTAAFSSFSGCPFFALMGRFFAFFAIVTSTLGVAFSIVDFIGDGLGIQRRRGGRRVFLTLLTFLPPFFFVLIKPDVFMTALSVAGGFGEAILNGLLPVGLLWVGTYQMKLKSDLRGLRSRLVLFLLILFSLFVIGLESYLLFIS